MTRKATLVILITLIATITAYGDVVFSIRYHDKNIYYPGDEVKLRLTLSNPVDSGVQDMTFHLSDDPVESFGFDVRSLSGEPSPSSSSYASRLNDPGAYRILHLGPGQELSITVALNDWADLSEPGQYRLTGFFFPDGRGRHSAATLAESVLDLTVMPETERRWEDQLSDEIRNALIHRNLDPRGVVEETLNNRRESRYNRAALYLDIESLAHTAPNVNSSDRLERMLLEGSWDFIPGFEHPSTAVTFVSSRVYPSEATVRVKAEYAPYGESFTRDLRFYLHNIEGYWTIRRVEALMDGDVDPARYGALDLEPPEVIAELLQAASRGDWDIVLRYYDVGDIVRNLPEYAEQWKDMSAAEHRRAMDDYRMQLISGRIEEGRLPLSGIGTWEITRVSYTDTEGSVSVESTTSYDTANGPLGQRALYTFRLSRSPDMDDQWRVMRYDTAVLR